MVVFFYKVNAFNGSNKSLKYNQTFENKSRDSGEISIIKTKIKKLWIFYGITHKRASLRKNNLKNR